MSIENVLQRVVNSLDEGLGLRLAQMTIWLLLGLGLLWAYSHQTFTGLREPQAMDGAQVGYRLSVGEGFTTACWRPSDVALLQRHGVDPVATQVMPEVRQAPAYPWLLAKLFRLIRPSFHVVPGERIFAPEKEVVLPLGWILCLATGWLVYLLGNRHFDARVGVVAATGVMLTERLLAVCLAGGPEALGVFLVTGALFAAYEGAANNSRHRAFGVSLAWLALAGLLSGAAALTGYVLIAVVPAIALFLWLCFVRGRALALCVYVGLALVVVLPWIVRNVLLTGGPLGAAGYELLSGSVLFPADALERTADIAVRPAIAWRAVQLKLYANLRLLMGGDLWAWGGGLLLALFGVSLLERSESDLEIRLRGALLTGFLLLVLLVSLGLGGARWLLAFVPVMALVGVACYMRMLERMLVVDEGRSTVAAILLLGVVAIPVLCVLGGARGAPAYPPYYPPFARYVSDLLDADEVMVTDIPWATAWYGQQRSLLLPRTPQALPALQASGMDIGGIYLTSALGDRAYLSAFVNGPEREWLPLYNWQVPTNFPWVHGFGLPPETRQQVFLTDRVRWGEDQGDRE